MMLKMYFSTIVICKSTEFIFWVHKISSERTNSQRKGRSLSEQRKELTEETGSILGWQATLIKFVHELVAPKVRKPPPPRSCGRCSLFFNTTLEVVLGNWRKASEGLRKSEGSRKDPVVRFASDG